MCADRNLATDLSLAEPASFDLFHRCGLVAHCHSPTEIKDCLPLFQPKTPKHFPLSVEKEIYILLETEGRRHGEWADNIGS
jgi:hypothetical protein